jgi:hypothetical protein
MILALPEGGGTPFEATGLRADVFERRCAAVGCVPAALVAPVEAGFGLEDERAAREEEGFVTDES